MIINLEAFLSLSNKKNDYPMKVVLEKGNFLVSSSSEWLQSRTKTTTYCVQVRSDKSPAECFASAPNTPLGRDVASLASSGDCGVCLGLPAETAEMEVLHKEKKPFWTWA